MATHKLVTSGLTTALLLLGACTSAAPPAEVAEQPAELAIESETREVAPTTADRVVTMEGALIRSFGLPSIADFAEADVVTDIVVGEVLTADSVVDQPGTAVSTELSVAVEKSRSGGQPNTIVVSEPGGIVTLAEVAGDFAGRIDPETLEAEADTTVDYQVVGQPHTEVGDKLMIFIGGDPNSGYFTLLRLRVEPDNTLSLIGEPGNPKWDTELTGGEARTMISSAE